LELSIIFLDYEINKNIDTFINIIL